MQGDLLRLSANCRTNKSSVIARCSSVGYIILLYCIFCMIPIIDVTLSCVPSEIARSTSSGDSGVQQQRYLSEELSMRPPLFSPSAADVIARWTVDEVTKFIADVEGCAGYAEVCIIQHYCRQLRIAQISFSYLSSFLRRLFMIGRVRWRFRQFGLCYLSHCIAA